MACSNTTKKIVLGLFLFTLFSPTVIFVSHLPGFVGTIQEVGPLSWKAVVPTFVITLAIAAVLFWIWDTMTAVITLNESQIHKDIQLMCVILLFTCFAGATALYLKKCEVPEWKRSTLLEEVENYQTNKDIQHKFNKIQSALQCCGTRNHHDFESIPVFKKMKLQEKGMLVAPKSCFKTEIVSGLEKTRLWLYSRHDQVIEDPEIHDGRTLIGSVPFLITDPQKRVLDYVYKAGCFAKLHELKNRVANDVLVESEYLCIYEMACQILLIVLLRTMKYIRGEEPEIK